MINAMLKKAILLRRISPAASPALSNRTANRGILFHLLFKVCPCSWNHKKLAWWMSELTVTPGGAPAGLSRARPGQITSRTRAKDDPQTPTLIPPCLPLSKKSPHLTSIGPRTRLRRPRYGCTHYYKISPRAWKRSKMPWINQL